jgi:hypothetical protein
MTDTNHLRLRELEALRGNYGPGVAARRLELLRHLEPRRLRSARQVLRLHEILAFLRAYPDDAAVLAQVERMLANFAARPDLLDHRDLLANSGVAGADIYYRFYWVISSWLARRWPACLTIDWPEFDNRGRLLDLLDLLLPYSETLAVDLVTLSAQEWLDLLKGPGETDAAFLIRRFAELDCGEGVRERLYEQLDVPLRLTGRGDTPSRTKARYGRPRVVFQRQALSRNRPSLRLEIQRPADSTRALSLRQGKEIIDLARGAMATRSRDLDAFADADPRDVRTIGFERGLEFACMGARPERRLMLESRYGLIILKNGVPIGYALATCLFGSAEIAYNIFDTFRGAEAALVFARLLAAVRSLFGCDAFAIDPFQLGYGNREGLASGAWWFYYKLGFRPHDPGVRAIVRRELAHMKIEPGHRSSLATLEQLAAAYVFFFGDRRRADVLGRVQLERIGLKISEFLARRSGSDREAAVRSCSREAAKRLGLDAGFRLSPDERLAWNRWGPLVCLLPGVESWSPAERRALIEVIRAKGGRRESEYLRRFDAHERLRAACLELAS